LDNVYDDSAMYRILTCPAFKICKKDVARIVLYQEKLTLSIYEALKQLPLISNLEPETKDKVFQWVTDRFALPSLERQKEEWLSFLQEVFHALL
jgi:hypothetical protein